MLSSLEIIEKSGHVAERIIMCTEENKRCIVTCFKWDSSVKSITTGIFVSLSIEVN
jgi:hypothetical protein